MYPNRKAIEADQKMFSPTFKLDYLFVQKPFLLNCLGVAIHFEDFSPRKLLDFLSQKQNRRSLRHVIINCIKDDLFSKKRRHVAFNVSSFFYPLILLRIGFVHCQPSTVNCQLATCYLRTANLPIANCELRIAY